ncbi:MAG: hypothetical protein K2M94_00325 [Paramuribaculum sp.]|nr:hypothetical protein [Paramuribaculum sp.]
MRLKTLSYKAVGKRMLLLMTAALTLGVMGACDDDKEIDVPVQPEPEPEPIEITSVELKEATPDCYYFIPWQQQHGNYYIELTTGEIGYDGMQAYPMNEGDYILCLDLYASADKNHSNPQLPSGQYTPTDNPNDNHDLTYSLVNTMAVYNAGKVESGQSKIKFIKFSQGTLDVTHNADGTYTLKGSFVGEADEIGYEFTYTGVIDIADMSGLEDEDWWGFSGNTQFTAQKANYIYYDDSQTKGVDNYIVRLFETTNITPDYMHQNEPGNKVSLYLFTEHGTGLAGTYTIRDTEAVGSCIPGIRFGAQATGTYVERVRADMSVRYALITEGTVTITENNGSYDVTVNCKTSEGATVNVTYKGAIDNITGKAPVYSTLEQDIAVYPLQCSAVEYFGDYYQNGTVNYGVVLATETELMCFEFVSATGTNTELPTGTFVVDGTNNAGSLTPGYIEDTTIAPTCYVQYSADASQVIGYAPVKGGTLDISKSGSDYTFTFALTDDGQPAHTITGTCTTTLPEITDYTEQMTTVAKRVAVGRNGVKKLSMIKL